MIEDWLLSQQNRICFVMVDNAGLEVSGLGAGFILQVSKNGGAFAASAGTKAEISNGWYTYLATAVEANTVGPVAIRVTGAGCVQQNLEYVVAVRNPGAKEWPYLVTNTGTGLAEPDVDVWFTTINLSTASPVWRGTSDAFGYVKDVYGENPWLDLGTYYVWKHKVGFIDPQFPDIEVVV